MAADAEGLEHGANKVALHPLREEVHPNPNPNPHPNPNPNPNPNPDSNTLDRANVRMAK